LTGTRRTDADEPSERHGFDLKTRLLLSVALIAVLLVLWLFQTRPSCLDGHAAALDKHLKWTCGPI
jgi:hypothetical protein